MQGDNEIFKKKIKKGIKMLTNEKQAIIDYINMEITAMTGKEEEKFEEFLERFEIVE